MSGDSKLVLTLGFDWKAERWNLVVMDGAHVQHFPLRAPRTNSPAQAKRVAGTMVVGFGCRRPRWTSKGSGFAATTVRSAT